MVALVSLYSTELPVAAPLRKLVALPLLKRDKNQCTMAGLLVAGKVDYWRWIEDSEDRLKISCVAIGYMVAWLS
jgi:hypothetical protein